MKHPPNKSKKTLKYDNRGMGNMGKQENINKNTAQDKNVEPKTRN